MRVRSFAAGPWPSPHGARTIPSPPPRIIDWRAAARGFIYLRNIVAACEALPEAFELRLCGADTPVRLLGLARPLDPGAGR
jgi:hypothetical protein